MEADGCGEKESRPWLGDCAAYSEGGESGGRGFLSSTYRELVGFSKDLSGLVPLVGPTLEADSQSRLAVVVQCSLHTHTHTRCGHYHSRYVY